MPNNSDESYIQLPLARIKMLGFGRATMLCRIENWIESNEKREAQMRATHFKLGMWWTYNSYEAWEEGLEGAMSARAIADALRDLEDLGLMRSYQFNSKKYDQRKWYTIDGPTHDRFIQLWKEYGSPRRGENGQPSDEYRSFLNYWKQQEQPVFDQQWECRLWEAYGTPHPGENGHQTIEYQNFIENWMQKEKPKYDDRWERWVKDYENATHLASEDTLDTSDGGG